MEGVNVNPAPQAHVDRLESEIQRLSAVVAGLSQPTFTTPAADHTDTIKALNDSIDLLAVELKSLRRDVDATNAQSSRVASAVFKNELPPHIEAIAGAVSDELNNVRADTKRDMQRLELDQANAFQKQALIANQTIESAKRVLTDTFELFADGETNR